MALPLGTEIIQALGTSSNGQPSGQTQPFTLAQVSSGPLLASGAITAAGTTQGGATVLTSYLNNVTTGTANQGVLLPPATAGLCVIVNNATGNTIKIYPAGTDTIDGGTASVAVTLTSLHRGSNFYCFVAGNWVSDLFGAVST